MNYRKSEVVHNTVAQLRHESGMTQAQLGSVIGVTRQTIIAIEKGDYVPSVLLAMKLAAHFNTTIEKVFYL